MLNREVRGEREEKQKLCVLCALGGSIIPILEYKHQL
jgi:hypothetical protein